MLGAVKLEAEAPVEDYAELRCAPKKSAGADFVCTFPKCGKRFKRARALRLHGCLHQDVKPYCCEVEGCSASYSRKQHLARHVEANHSKPDAEYKCDRTGCVASFDTKISLDNHLRRKHGGFKRERFHCDVCSSSFAHVWQLQEHSVSHGQSNPFKCEYCDEAFDVYLMYKTHLKKSHLIRLTHKNEKLVIQSPVKECEYCGAKFKKYRELTEHCRAQHPFSCQYCLQTFRNKSRLCAHSCYQNQTQERFSCAEEGCTKSYLHERNLRIHIRAAHKGEVHTCPFCERNLRTKQKLQEHVTRIHENPNPSVSKRTRRGKSQGKSLKQSVVERLTGPNDNLRLYRITKLGPKPQPQEV